MRSDEAWEKLRKWIIQRRRVLKREERKWRGAGEKLNADWAFSEFAGVGFVLRRMDQLLPRPAKKVAKKRTYTDKNGCSICHSYGPECECWGKYNEDGTKKRAAKKKAKVK